MLHRRNTEYSNCITEQAHGDLGTGNLSLFRGKANFPGTKTFIPWMDLAKSAPRREHRSRFPLSFIKASEKVLGQPDSIFLQTILLNSF